MNRPPLRLSQLVAPILLLALVSAIACGASANPDEPAPSSSQAEEPAQVTLPAQAEQPTDAPTLPPSPAVADIVQDRSTSSPAVASPTATMVGASEVPSTLEPTSSPRKHSVGAEPDWAKELRQAGIYASSWETNFSKHSVPYNEIFSGGVPRDGIPPIDNPKFVSVSDADSWLEAKEPVVALELNGEAKAYPLQILTWHEIVNDTVSEIPVAATFCPLCNSAIVFDRRLDGAVYDFGVSGNLRNSDLIMWDRQTESWWQQLTGEAIVGQLTGQRLAILPATIVAWQDFKETYPEAQVLSRDTGHSRNYGSNPYVGYDEVGQSPFLFFGKTDERLLPTERVAALTFEGEAIAFPFSFLEAEKVVHYPAGDQNLVVFFRPGARSALDGFRIADSREVGSTGIFLRDLEGQTLTFSADDDVFIDLETGSRWNIFGQALSGPLAGSQLTPVVHANHFWFAWAAFRPDTRVVRETT